MMNDVTIILNGYKRPHTLRDQIDAVKRQTIAPKDIMYWQNSIPEINYDIQSSRECISAYAGVNFGVWARFAFALNARTNWICVLDDDTIPGTQWLENCLYTHEKTPGLLGTIGIRFPTNSYTFNFGDRYGWDGNNNDETQKVDIVGHSWFFHRDILSTFWRELPPIEHSLIAGEDIHFSAMVQKYTNMGTFVPPHPVSNREMWGSLRGWEIGADANATAGHAVPLMYEWMDYYLQRGFKLLHEG